MTSRSERLRTVKQTFLEHDSVASVDEPNSWWPFRTTLTGPFGDASYDLVIEIDTPHLTVATQVIDTALTSIKRGPESSLHYTVGYTDPSESACTAHLTL